MGDYNVVHAIPWGGAYAFYFFTIGISAALFFLSALSWFREEYVPLRRPTAYVSFVLLLVSAALLIGDLSQPARFFHILLVNYLNFASPLAWGTLNLVLFAVVSVAYVIAIHKNHVRGSKTLAVIGALLAASLPIYTGYDLTVHQNRPVWNTPLIPVLFVALSLASGAAVAYLLVSSDAVLSKVLRSVMLWTTAGIAAMLVSMMGTTAYGGVGSELTFMLLTEGSLGFVFVVLGMVVGTLLPIALMLLPQRRPQMVAAAAVLLLVGGFALRYSILIGGQIVQTYF
ncbi:MAG TPA: NrfD/PsrC family molybdoenzyme membrane anchor subunit [Usitatibacter sp.]|nr:NrfD/PsrC family molybdoenzyme membrane anchor subunit [Usitatibacter sp.]